MFMNHLVSSAIVSQTFLGRVQEADSTAEDPKWPAGRAREEWRRKGSDTTALEYMSVGRGDDLKIGGDPGIFRGSF